VELFHDLVRQADVVVDNYRFGVRKRLGIDYAALRAINPRVISCSINAYGAEGDRAALPGFDPLLQAEGGMMAAQGGLGTGDGNEPILHTIPVNDVATSAMVAFGVITALNVRDRTGEGQEVLTSLMAQSLTFQLGEVTTYEGRPPNEVGGVDCLGVSALHRFYRCADGWIAIVCDTPRAALTLMAVLDLPWGDGDEALAERRDGPLAKTMETVLAARVRDDILRALLGAGVACAPALRGPEAIEDPWLWDNRLFDVWRHPRVGDIVSSRGYADFSRTPAGFTRPTPDLGEHSTEVLTEMGISPERIQALFASGAVFEPAHLADHTAKSARPGDGGVALMTQ